MTFTDQKTATIQAQTATNDEKKMPEQISSQYLLNNFYANLARINKNIIRVKNINLNSKGIGEFIGSPSDFCKQFALSQSTDLLVAMRTYGQIKPEIAERINGMTDPNAITDIFVAFFVGNHPVTASFTLVNVKEVFDVYTVEQQRNSQSVTM